MEKKDGGIATAQNQGFSRGNLVFRGSPRSRFGDYREPSARGAHRNRGRWWSKLHDPDHPRLGLRGYRGVFGVVAQPVCPRGAQRAGHASVGEPGRKSPLCGQPGGDYREQGPSARQGGARTTLRVFSSVQPSKSTRQFSMIHATIGCIWSCRIEFLTPIEWWMWK